jgi:hypothetical protein
VLIYHPKRVFNFPKRLVIEFVTEVVLTILAAFLVAQTSITSFAGRVGFFLVVGILAAIATNVPYWNWYGFPKVYTFGLMLTEIVAFFLAGIVAALVLGKRATS